MPSPHPAVVVVSDRQRAILRRLSRSRKSAASLVERSRLILLAAEGLNNQDIALELGVDRQRVRRWRNRWARELSGRLAEVEGVADDGVLAVAVEEVLSDRHRSGTPPKFSVEQEERVRALACREPSEFGLPHSHWTRRLLAEEAARQGIVESVSIAEVGRWLKKGGFSPTGAGTG